MVDVCGQIAVVDRRTGSIVRDLAGVSDRGIGEAKEAEKYSKNGGASGAGSRRNSLSTYQFRAEEEVDWKTLWGTGTDAVLDVPIGGVCEILYGNEDDSNI